MNKTKRKKSAYRLTQLVQAENKKDGDVFTPVSLMKNRGKRVPLTLEFNLAEQIGWADLEYVDGQGLMARLEITKYLKRVNGLKPAIGFILIAATKTDAIQYIEDMEVTTVGCVKEHTDPDIKPIEIKKIPKR